MIVRKNFKRDEVLLKVRNRLEASNLEVRLRLMRHEVERRRDCLKREMVQIIDNQQQCKRSSGDSITVYKDLVLNSPFQFGVHFSTQHCGPESKEIMVNNENQLNTSANCLGKEANNEADNRSKGDGLVGSTASRMAALLPKIDQSKEEEPRSAKTLKLGEVAQNLSHNRCPESVHDKNEPSKIAEVDQTDTRCLTNQKLMAEKFCPKSNDDEDDDRKLRRKTLRGKLRLPKIVASSTSLPSPKVRTAAEGNTESLNNENKVSRYPSTLGNPSKEKVKFNRENLTVAVDSSHMEQRKKSFRQSVLNAPTRLNRNILRRNKRESRMRDNKEMIDIVARITSELKLEYPSPLFGNFGPDNYGTVTGGNNPDSNNPTELCRPPNRLIQKGRFLPERMSSSDASDDSKSQTSTIDDSPYILYKGRKLRNYVKPQDRFRVDQAIKMRKKQQLYLKLLKNRPDDLTKCSLQWDPALGDTDSLQLSQPAKRKALERIVEANMSRSAALPLENDRTELNNRVKEFMDSLGNSSNKFFI